MDFYKKLAAFACLILILSPTSAFAESKYWQIDLIIDNGNVDTVGSIVQKYFAEEYDPQSEGDYKISLIFEDELIASNNFSIPEYFDIEAINFDGSRNNLQSKSGIIQVEFKKPDAYQASAEKNITVRIEKDGRMVKEEKVSVIDYDNEPIQKPLVNEPSMKNNNSWLAYVIGMGLVGVILGIWYWSNKRKQQI